MAPTPVRKRYQRIPKGKVRLSIFVWSGAFLAICFGLNVLATRHIEGFQFPRSDEYLGSMKSSAKPVAVEIPAGAAVEELLVRSGDKIRRGQTLASLDKHAITQALAEVEKAKADNEALLACLSSVNEGGKKAGFPPDMNADSVAVRPMHCQELADQSKKARQRFEAQISKTETDISIIERYFQRAASLKRLNGADTTDAELDRLLALSLTRSSLKERLRDIEAEQSEEAFAILQRKSELILETERGLREQQRRVTHLNALLSSPRIQSPVSGKVIRLRRVPLGQAVQAPTEIISILPQQEVGYQVAFVLPHNKDPMIQVGQVLRLKAVGLPELVDDLEVKVTHLSNEGGRLTVHGALSLPSTQALAASRYSRQILANSSAVSVRLYGKPQAAEPYLSSLFAKGLVKQPSAALHLISRAFATTRSSLYSRRLRRSKAQL